MLGMQMLTPTVNMFIKGDSFVKLAKDPKRYLNMDPYPIIDKCVDEGGKPHPIIGIDDIRLNCLHYENCEEAINAWNRRRKRVNFDNVMVISTSWDLNYDKELIQEILNLPTPCIMFSYDETDGENENVIRLDKKIWSKDAEGNIYPTLTGYYRHGIYRNYDKIFDIVEWINKSVKE